MQFLKLIPSHLTNRNKGILLLALLFSLAALYALFKVQPKEEDQSRKMLAILEDQTQFVSRKHSNALSFIEIKKGENLFDGDQIFTGENSTAKVIFQKSGNILTIPPKGLVKIVEGSNGESVNIQKGLAEFVIQKGQTMAITQGTEVLTLKNDDDEQGSGKIFFEDNKIVLKVDSGKINLNDSKGKNQEIKKDESVSYINDAPPLVEESLPLEKEAVAKIPALKLTNPISGQRIDIWNPLILEWLNSSEVEAVLYKDSEFKEVVAKTSAEISPFQWILPLQEGLHYLVVNPKGKDNESVTIPLEMFSGNNITTFTPEDNAVVNLKRGDNLKLSWNAVPASRYKITISANGGENISFMSDIPEYEVQGIKGASLTWSVAPQLVSGVVLKESAINHVNLIFENSTAIISPKKNQKFIFIKDKIELSWKALKDENISVKLINTSLNKVLFEKDIIDNKMIFTPEVPGNYSLIVKSKDFPSGLPSEVNFSVNSIIAEWELNAPVELSSIDPEENKVELKFNPINKNLNEYELSVYNDTDLTNNILTSKVITSKIIYTVKNYGTLCFILRPLNKVSNWLPSSSQCIVYTQKAPFEIIAAGKNVVLKYQKSNGIGSYIITLPEVQNANSYEVQVFNKSRKLVFSDRSSSNVIVWPSTKTGVFYYRYRVMDAKKRTSAYSAVSKLIFPISPLSELK